MKDIMGWIILSVWIVIYFLPTLVAFFRCKRNTPAILVLNLLAGWTGLGWIVAAVWSFTTEVPVTSKKEVLP